MLGSNMLRSSAIVLLVVLGLLDLGYGFLYAGGNYENLWYVMGAIYIALAGAMLMNIRPLLYQPIVLGYPIFLFFAWLTAGVSRDPVAYADKAIEVILAISMFQLIRVSHPAPIVSRTA